VESLAHVDRDAVHERLLAIDLVSEAEIEADIRGRNVCHRELDRRGRPESTPDVAERALLLRQRQTSSASETSEQGKGAAVWRPVDSLPVAFRELIVLRELNDLSYREIAEVVGVSLGTVATLLAQARASLAAKWKANDPDAQQQSDLNCLEHTFALAVPVT
jgi:RNA polymerase sigma factor (sigma-70 family)